METALQNCPKEIEHDIWVQFCEIFNNDGFKRRSEINKSNRAQQVVTHGNGSKGFARREFEMEQEKSERPRFSALYFVTHQSKKKGGWVSDESKENYEKAMAIIASREAEGVEVDEQVVFTEVLGEKKSYIRGLGPGPKPSALRFQKLALKELELAKREKELLAKELELAEQRLVVERESREKELLDKERAEKEVEALKEQTKALTEESEKRRLEVEEAHREAARANSKVEFMQAEMASNLKIMLEKIQQLEAAKDKKKKKKKY